MYPEFKIALWVRDWILQIKKVLVGKITVSL